MTNAQMTPINAERNPIVTARDGEAFADSRDVAAFFGKQVKHVHEAIRNLIAKEPSLGLANFRPFKIKDFTGESISHYDMDRDGFSLLAMGFTGAKALKWKLAYIKAFGAMEAEISRQAKSGPMIDMNDPAALRGLLLSYSEQAIELRDKVDELQPKADAFHRIAEADGSECITNTAKALQMRPKDLFAYLRQHHWIYRRAGTKTDLGYQSKVNSGLLEHKVTTITGSDGIERERVQVRVTARGMTRLASEIQPAMKLISAEA